MAGNTSEDARRDGGQVCFVGEKDAGETRLSLIHIIIEKNIKIKKIMIIIIQHSLANSQPSEPGARNAAAIEAELAVECGTVA